MPKNKKEVLQQYWGFPHFKGSQETVMDTILSGRDVLALMPTGGGKSLCYQIPAMVKEGICIVISPLVALIHDQVNGLKQKGIKAIALTGGIHYNEVNDLLDNCLYGNYKFLYLSPERLEQDIVKDRIRQMNVNLIAIDEAHCISQWGNDFRPAYLNCSILRELAPTAPVIALTATATQRVAQDIASNLKFNGHFTVKDSFARDNISFIVTWEEDKRYQLKSLCSQATKSVIVYVRSRRLAQETSAYLAQNGCTSAYFHGGMSKKEKQNVLNLWLENKVQTIVATNAFGMGIDKPDVELVIHYQIPDSLENYFQEAGRAGRNGKPAKAILIAHKDDGESVRNQFLSVLPDVAFIKLLYKKLNSYFQIPYGEGSQQTLQFKFNTFCDAYNFNPILTYNGLRMLDQHSVIALSETFSKKTTIKFIAPKQELFRYLEKNPSLAPTIQTILRTYGGLYEYDTKINTLLIAKKATVPEIKVISILKQLLKDGIITYEDQLGDLEITFLVPREDERTINRCAKKIKELLQVKTNNVEHMLSYVENDRTCRKIQLLAYFGEKNKEKCGTCDVCTKNNTPQKNILMKVEQEIVQALKKKRTSSRGLVQLLGYEEHVILNIIQKLLENEQVAINSKNEYVLI